MKKLNNLSPELKANEIHERAVGFYKISEQYGYKFLMEVKTIRDEKLYKELGFETFEDYTLNNFNFDKRTINRRLQDAESFGEEYETALTSFGKHKTHQLATFPKEQRNYVIEHGIDTPDGNKSLEEATTRELEDYKKRNKSLEQQNAQLQSQVEQAHLTTKTLFHMWLNSMYTRTVVLYLHNMISTINNSITKACTGTISP